MADVKVEKRHREAALERLGHSDWLPGSPYACWVETGDDREEQFHVEAAVASVMGDLATAEAAGAAAEHAAVMAYGATAAMHFEDANRPAEAEAVRTVLDGITYGRHRE